MTCPAIKWKIWGLNPGSLALESTAKWKTYGTDPCLHTSMGPLTIPTPTIYTNSKASEYVMSLVSVCLWPNLASVRVSHWCWHPDIHIWKTKTMQGEENLKKKKDTINVFRVTKKNCIHETRSGSYKKEHSENNNNKKLLESSNNQRRTSKQQGWTRTKKIN